MWKYLKIFLSFYFIVITKCSLLEMSQSMWTKLLEGGLSKIGQLDPLRVPMVKVDQSEGNTSYRMVLRNIEILGLNDSTVESIHVARGKLKSHLSELEAGFVTYSDLGDLESIRYKFHTVVNNMRKEIKNVDVTTSSFNSSKFENITEYLPRYLDSEKSSDSNSRNYDQQQQSRLQERQYRESQDKLIEVTTDSAYLRNFKIEERLESHRSIDDKSKYPSSVHVIYAQSMKNSKINQETYQKDKDELDCFDNSDPRRDTKSNLNQESYQTSKLIPNQSEDLLVSVSKNEETKLQQPTEISSASLFADQRRDYQRSGNIGGNVKQSNERSDQSYLTDQKLRNYQRNGNNEKLGQSTERSGSSYYTEQQQNYQRNGNEGRLGQSTERSGSSYYTEQQQNYQRNGNEGRLGQSTERSGSSYYTEQQQNYQRNGNEGRLGQSTERSDGSSYYDDHEHRNYQRNEGRLGQSTERSDGSSYYVDHEHRNYQRNEGRLGQSTERSDSSYYVDHEHRNYQRNEGRLGQSTERSDSSYYVDHERRDYKQSDNVEGKIKRMSHGSESIKSGIDQRLENKPGYIDIVYADEKNSNGVKRFGNMRLEANRETKVYGFEDVMKDIRDNRRILIHNFTDGELLTKKNDRVRAALEAKRLKDLSRYAGNYEEKEGYFEEGMELIYHYGGMGNKSKEIKRVKRAHMENDTTEEDVIHVIMRIHVPLLRIKSEYMLTGKVGEEVLRGNGLLSGNFTELHGDFMVELKKGINESIIVRATRAKLSAKNKNIDLQGMNEEGPVKSILTQGLMAAEAVAAMLADDLTTKALSEKTADAMVYRMYNDLPMVN